MSKAEEAKNTDVVIRYHAELLGRIISTRRQLLKVGQADLAKTIDTSRATVSNMETGSANVRLKTWLESMAALGILGEFSEFLDKLQKKVESDTEQF